MTSYRHKNMSATLPQLPPPPRRQKAGHNINISTWAEGHKRHNSSCAEFFQGAHRQFSKQATTPLRPQHQRPHDHLMTVAAEHPSPPHPDYRPNSHPNRHCLRPQQTHHQRHEHKKQKQERRLQRQQQLASIPANGPGRPIPAPAPSSFPIPPPAMSGTHSSVNPDKNSTWSASSSGTRTSPVARMTALARVSRELSVRRWGRKVASGKVSAALAADMETATCEQSTWTGGGVPLHLGDTICVAFCWP